MDAGIKIDLNCDMGESYGNYRLGADNLVMPWITSANIACGMHAGDPVVMEHTVKLAADYNVSVGAHPGYPDLQGFGRRKMELTPAEVETFVLYQIGALAAFCRAAGVDLVHVKPHGALYNQAAKDRPLADALARAVARYSTDLILVGLSGSALVEAGRHVGLRVANEGFPDRGYLPDGSLRARSEAGAVLDSVADVCTQALRLAHVGLSGTRIDTLCIHGDGAHAVEFARAVREKLNAAGIQVVPLREIIHTK